MTTPRIEEIKAEFKMFVPEDDGSAMDWLENTLTEIRQETLDEAVDVLKSKRKNKNSIKHFSGNGYYNQQGYNQALDDTIKALQDKK